MSKFNSKTKVVALTALVASTAIVTYASQDNKSTSVEEDVNTAKLVVEKVDKDTVRISIDNVNNSIKAFQLGLKIDGNVEFSENIKWLTKVDTSDTSKAVNEEIINNYKLSADKKEIDIFVTADNELSRKGSLLEVCEIDVSKTDLLGDTSYKILPNAKVLYKSIDENNKVTEEVSMQYEDVSLSINTPPTIELKDSVTPPEGSEKPVIDKAKNKITIIEGYKFDAKTFVNVADEEDKSIGINDVVVEDDKGNPVTGVQSSLKPGTYVRNYTVTDSSSESTTLRVDVVVEPEVWKTLPTLTGVPTSDIKIKAGDVFNPLMPDGKTAVKAVDAKGNDLEVEVSGDFDLNVGGRYPLTYTATDRFDNTISKSFNLIVEGDTTPSIPPTTVTKLIGEDRYETAVKISQEGWSKADTVILVNGHDNYLVDGLTATPLASVKNAPVLLSNNNTLSKHTINEIKRLNPSKIIVIGGETSMPNSVISEIKKIDSSISIQRIGGQTRYETSLNIAKEIDKTNDITNIYVGAGNGEADSLSISSVAGREKAPIILTGKDGLDKNTYDYLKSQNVLDGYIIGGENSISEKAISQIDEVVKSDISNNVISGLDRQETNAKVIETFYKDTKLEGVVVAREYELVDALAVGPLAAKYDMPVVLATKSLNKAQEYTLKDKKSENIYETGGGILSSVIDRVKELVNNRK